MITYHPRAKTNIHIRRLIKESHESHYVLAQRFNLNPKTILKWKHRSNLQDKPYGAKIHHFTLNEWEQKIVVKVRKHLKHNLDDLVLILKPYIPKINRGSCYRVLVKHQINKLPLPFKDQGKGKFSYYLPGFLHLDLAYLPLLSKSYKRRYLQAAVDRVTKIVFLMVVNGKTQKEAIRFLQFVIKFYSYHIHRILTDNGKEYGKDFTKECQRYGIKHKKTKVKHPWTNGMAEITIQQIKKATIWQTFYQSYQQMEQDLTLWQNDYNLTRKLKSLKYLTPYQKMVEYYQSLTLKKQKSRFKKKPRELLITTPLYRET